MKFIGALILTLSIISCADNPSESEPCDWYQSKFSATVTSIEFKEINGNNDSTFTVLLDFTAGSLSNELQDLGEIKNMEITKEKIKKNRIAINATYTGTISDLKSGDCKTPIVAFDQRLH